MMRVTAIDFETANKSPASVCAVGISIMEDGAVESVLSTLIKPEDNVSYFSRWNIAVHGILPRDVLYAPRFDEVYREMLPSFDGALVCGHNVRFDMGCLKASCENCGLPVPHLYYFDTLELSRKVFPQLAHHRLNDMCEYLNIELEHHKADSDALGCLMIVARVMEMAGNYDIEQILEMTGVRIYELT